MCMLTNGIAPMYMLPNLLATYSGYPGLNHEVTGLISMLDLTYKSAKRHKTQQPHGPLK